MPLPRGVRNRLTELSRLQGVVTILVRHGLGTVVDRLGLGSGPARGPAARARLGRRIASALTDLGPTFVKLGQVLATRDDVLPPEITVELATLQQSVRAVPTTKIRHEIELALGVPIEACFATFDARPLAAASIAQVHRATTLDGREVVCKVRRPGIERKVDDDLALLGMLAELMVQRVEEVRRYDPLGLFAEFAGALRRELDFRQELEALVRMHEVVGSTAILPHPIPELSSERLLTMTYVPGDRLDAVHAPERRALLARQLLRTYVRQILRGGFFHADPHPGNLMALGTDLVLLDFGAVATFTPEMRQELVGIATAAAERDGASLATALLPILVEPGPPDIAAYTAEVGQFLEDLLAQDLGQVRLRDLSDTVWKLSRQHELRIKPAYLQLLRTVATLDGVLEQLDPGLDPVRAARGYVLGETVAAGAEAAVEQVRTVFPAPVLALVLGAGMSLAAVLALLWSW